MIALDSELTTSVHLAIDLGAGSGRVVAATFNGHQMEFEEIARFENPGIELLGHCHWDLLALHKEIVEAITFAAKQYKETLVSCAICTWGVDFALLDDKGRLVGLPHQYRDPRTQGMEKLAHTKMTEEEVYAHTGIQNVFFNSSFQLLAEVERNYPALETAERLLFTPELLAYWLTGVMSHERSICSTSQLFNPQKADWAWEVINAFQIPKKLFGEVHSSGKVLGLLTENLQEQTGARHLQVVSGAGHDTAACVAGLPLPEDKRVAWISSGTWSLFGTEISQPICTQAAFKAGFSNEQGINNTTRLLANISGLWLIQQCRDSWQKQSGEPVEYADLVAEARRAKPLSALLDPDCESFREAGNMPEKIVAWLEKTGQETPAPSERGRLVRIIVDSLALRYRKALHELEELLGEEVSQIHIGGGGSANELLNQATANACQKPVVAGPMEATSCGNILTQLVALNKVPNWQAARQVVEHSFPTKLFTPETEGIKWQEAEQRLAAMIQKA